MSFDKDARACRLLAREFTGRSEGVLLLKIARAFDEIAPGRPSCEEMEEVGPVLVAC